MRPTNSDFFQIWDWNEISNVIGTGKTMYQKCIFKDKYSESAASCPVSFLLNKLISNTSKSYQIFNFSLLFQKSSLKICNDLAIFDTILLYEKKLSNLQLIWSTCLKRILIAYTYIYVFIVSNTRLRYIINLLASLFCNLGLQLSVLYCNGIQVGP